MEKLQLEQYLNRGVENIIRGMKLSLIHISEPTRPY